MPSSTVRGHVHPLAQARFDRGKVSDRFILERVTMMFKPTAEQENELNTLLEQQQDPASPNYHRWLTPEEYADRFGMDTTQFNNAVNWLQNWGFTIDERARGRNWVTFTGTAKQMEGAFNTRIDEFAVNGESHFAAVNEPAVPRALAGKVLAFRSLHNFRPRAHGIKNRFTSNISGYHFIAPDDFATIYDLHKLYDSGITGAGQKIAIMGQSDIQLQDIRTFRSVSGLPASDPQIVLVPGSKDPGVVSGDVDESSLDLEWAGAIARNASIVFVISDNALGVFDSLQYAINNNLAPVMSVSYGDCEANWSAADRSSLTANTQQANAQGITIVAAAGDAGAADCDGDFSGRSAAQLGLAVDLPSSLPYVTGMGGTQFNEPGNVWTPSQVFGSFFGKAQPTYWSSTNNGNNGSAQSYIPEIAWNDTLLAGALSSSGGGRSTLFPKPSWQAGNGVPNDNARDVPDISFGASPYNDGFLACSLGNCVNGYRASDNSLFPVGGTSVGAPSFAGVVALINQKTNSRQGNVNPTIYRIAASVPTAFHDITQGGNQVPCSSGTPDCPASGYLGYAAAPGYDLATGLGSLDIFKFVTAWGGQ